MAKRINVLNSGNGTFPVPIINELKVKSGTTSSITPGMLVITDASNAGYVKAAADQTDTDDVIVGVAVGTSTETASADGVIIIESAPYLLAEIFAEIPANLTQAMCLTNRYTLAVNSGDYVLDQAVTTKGIFRLVNFDNTTTGLCKVMFQCTIW